MNYYNKNMKIYKLIINAYKNKIMIWNKIYKNKLDKIYNILLRLNSYKKTHRWIKI